EWLTYYLLAACAATLERERSDAGTDEQHTTDDHRQGVARVPGLRRTGLRVVTGRNLGRHARRHSRRRRAPAGLDRVGQLGVLRLGQDQRLGRVLLVGLTDEQPAEAQLGQRVELDRGGARLGRSGHVQEQLGAVLDVLVGQLLAGAVDDLHAVRQRLGQGQRLRVGGDLERADLLARLAGDLLRRDLQRRVRLVADADVVLAGQVLVQLGHVLG